ncbi:MAG: MarR family protein [Candidatus Methanofastidiosum methylothiophilum]|uniref:MarR family protein n=1 Tax=Candidatus Methanofastidiosum methylothiophilum TaxID=1705564 RepID=A0A150IN51_9EURY|nr:MAG: MarR family protein [Candidatus Methanofastidiosum methylthiophilus]KYC48104.1 MAG: MarR family protein [Candidatus Methanofastidiosum methylthiophilus]KYC50657.1 MAG: MarR family protein [Candidatus Methanofastidiosum methylthiophilus]
MRNRIVGILIIFVSLLMGFIIFSFNRAMTEIVNTSCEHGSSCPMWGTIDFQTNVSIAIMSFVILIGIYLIFFGKEERTDAKEEMKDASISKEAYEEIMRTMNNEEKIVLESIINSNGTIFQSELTDKTNFNKVKVTRILDKLEGRGIIERRRRGMTNVIILKH